MLGAARLHRAELRPQRPRARRQAAVAAELPDALDLLSVSVEAGLGFDGAVQKLTEHMDGPLIEEFELALGEMRIGESRQDALKKMAERSASPEMASFVRAIIQADQLGISLGRILRVQAADTRLEASAARRGEGDEGADQDALPDGPLHLPGDVHRHPRAPRSSTSPRSSSSRRPMSAR